MVKHQGQLVIGSLFDLPGQQQRSVLPGDPLRALDAHIDLSMWRKERDSNPRRLQAGHGGLANLWDKPLPHPSNLIHLARTGVQVVDRTTGAPWERPYKGSKGDADRLIP